MWASLTWGVALRSHLDKEAYEAKWIRWSVAMDGESGTTYKEDEGQDQLE